MSFLHPAYLWGLSGAAIPILIHLYGRRRPRRVLFPSLRLLRRTSRQRRSLVRLRNLIILALRILAILAVVLALAGPVSENPLLRALAPARTTALILVDTSASMQYREAQETPENAVFERARDAARQVLQSLPGGCTPVLGTASNTVKLITPPGADRAAAERTLATLQPGFGRAILNADLQQAAQILTRLDAEHGRIFLVTDNQASSWTGPVALSESGPKLPLWVIDVSAKNPRNLAVSGVHPADEVPIPGRPLRYEAELYSSDPGGRNLAGPVTVTVTPTGQEAFAREVPKFAQRARFSFETPGAEGGVLSLPADNLAPDNRRYYPGYGRTKLRIAGQIGAGVDGRYLLAALESIGGITVENGPISPAKLADFDLVLLANVPDIAPETLAQYRQYVESGGGIVIFAGENVRPEAYNARVLPALVGKDRLLVGVKPVLAAHDSALGETDTLRPPLKAFASPKAGDLHEISFRRCLSLSTSSEVAVRARFDDDTPAIVECAVGSGHVIFVNTSADSAWSDAPLKPVWVPLLHRLAFHYARTAQAIIPDGYVGETVRIAVPTACRGGQLRITGEGAAPEDLSAREGVWDYTYGQPGRYHASWDENGKGREAGFVVNVDPAESELEADKEKTIGACKGLDASFVSYEQLPERLKGTSLARADLAMPLLILAALCLLAEGLLAALGGKRQVRGQGEAR